MSDWRVRELEFATRLEWIAAAIRARDVAVEVFADDHSMVGGGFVQELDPRWELRMVYRGLRGEWVIGTDGVPRWQARTPPLDLTARM